MTLARDATAPITIYHIGEPAVEGEEPKGGLKPWWDLCAGPHVEHTGLLPKDAISLESIAGAYWRGDEKRPMLQRVYGTAWQNAEQLAAHEEMQKEAKRRDHRKIGKDLNLFSIQQEAGGGLVFWHPKGAQVRSLLEGYWKEAHLKGGYELLYTPHMASVDLWKTSGHFDFYKDGMFDQMEVEVVDRGGRAPRVEVRTKGAGLQQLSDRAQMRAVHLLRHERARHEQHVPREERELVGEHLVRAALEQIGRAHV